MLPGESLCAGGSEYVWVEGVFILETSGTFCFLLHLIFLLTERILSASTDFGRPKQGKEFVAPPFHICRFAES